VHTAQEVFQDQAFWWKRIERVEASPSWLGRPLRAVLDFIWSIVGALWEFVQKLLKSMFGIATGDWSAGVPLLWLVAALLLVWAVWKLYPTLARWLGRTGPASVPAAALPFEQLPEALLLYDQARQALQGGQYAETIRLALLALIARLQQRGLLRYDPARTNREYQLDLRPAPEVASIFGEVVRPYERIWYGRLPATVGDAERVLGACRPVVTGEEHPGA
jgi:hypothetical protein